MDGHDLPQWPHHVNDLPHRISYSTVPTRMKGKKHTFVSQNKV